MSLGDETLDALRGLRQPARLRADWRRRGLQDDATVGALLTGVHRQAPWRQAVVDGDVRLTHGELDDAASALAAVFADAGVRAGDVVSWQSPNWWESVVVALATWRLGAINNPILTIYREHELRQIIGDLRPAVVVAPERFRKVAHLELLETVLDEVGHSPALKVVLRGTAPGWKPMEDLLGGPGKRDPTVVEPDAPCIIAYTSGTTARAKGVVLDARALLAETRQMAGTWGLCWEDATFMPAPLAHINGATVGLTVPLSVGGSVVLMDVWEPERAVPLIERERTVISAGTPTFLEEICHGFERRGVTEAPLRQFSVGGSAVPPTLIERCDAVGIGAFRCYGMTEHSSVTIANRGCSLETRRDTDGPIAPGTEVLCVDDEGRPVPRGAVGELRVRGPERMMGYVDPRDNADVLDPREGWFSTGDLAFVDDAGRIRFSGRVKDIINRGGEKFSAREMEDVICCHDAIRQAAVVPAPDERLGEVPVAFLVLHDCVRAPAPEDLERFVRDRGLAVQKVPTSWHVIERLPTTPFGKVRKQELIATLGRS